MNKAFSCWRNRCTTRLKSLFHYYIPGNPYGDKLTQSRLSGGLGTLGSCLRLIGNAMAPIPLGSSASISIQGRLLGKKDQNIENSYLKLAASTFYILISRDFCCIKNLDQINYDLLLFCIKIKVTHNSRVEST